MPDGGFADLYNPRKVLDDPSFRVLGPNETPSPDANIAAFYNPDHVIHLVEKPRPKPGPGQVLLHVRATGICGYVRWPLLRTQFKCCWSTGVMCIFGNMVVSVIR